MAAPDDTELTGFINSNLPDAEPGKVRRISPAAIRFVLLKLKDWVKTGINNNLSTWLRVSDKQPGGANTEAVYRTGKAVFGRDYSNGTAAALEATQAWIDNLNGYRVSPWFTITQPGDGLGGTQYYSICELPANAGNTYDFAQIEFIGKAWDSTLANPVELSICMANRGGFRYQYTSKGDPGNGTGIIAMQQADGRTVVYMVSDNAFKAISARVVCFSQAVIYQTPGYSTSLYGTEVFNSTKPGQYRAYMALRNRFTSFSMINSDGGVAPAPISEAGSAQLSFGANMVAGSSEVALINSNLVGGGFSFWQQTGAAVKGLLAFLNSAGDLSLAGMLRFNGLANRKVVLAAGQSNDHQFYGFGIQSGAIRYQVDAPAAMHIFYSGATALTSNELMRLLGTGQLLLGLSVDNGRDMLQVGGSISGKILKQSGDVQPNQLPADSWRISKNTDNGQIRLVVNDGGAIKSILFQ